MRLRFLLGVFLIMPPALLGQEQVPAFNSMLDSLEGLRSRYEMSVSPPTPMQVVPGSINIPELALPFTTGCTLNDAEIQEKLLLQTKILAELSRSEEHYSAFMNSIPQNCERSVLNYYRAAATTLGVTP